jgi:hypothetical protein
MKCPKCKTQPHTPIQIKRVGMCRWCEKQVELWIDGYSNSGTRIQTAALKTALEQFQEKYPERKYILIRRNELWFIGRQSK